MAENKRIVYSKNEKILRYICFAGIILSEIVGVLLICLGKIGGGISTLVACAFASFLVSSFMISKIKFLFKDNKKKRVIYALFYAFIIVLAMLTATFAGLTSTYPASELAEGSIELAENEVKKQGNSVSLIETSILDYFTYGDSMYFELEIEYTQESMGVKTDKTTLIYIKANRETARCERISSYQFIVSKSYS